MFSLSILVYCKNKALQNWADSKQLAKIQRFDTNENIYCKNNYTIPRSRPNKMELVNVANQATEGRG